MDFFPPGRLPADVLDMEFLLGLVLFVVSFSRWAASSSVFGQQPPLVCLACGCQGHQGHQGLQQSPCVGI